jgi:hypothetical protein
MSASRAIPGIIIFLVLSFGVVRQAAPEVPDQDTTASTTLQSSQASSRNHSPPGQSSGTVDLKGKLTNANQEPISNAQVKVSMVPAVGANHQSRFSPTGPYGKLSSNHGTPITPVKLTSFSKAQKSNAYPDHVFGIKFISENAAAGKAIAAAQVDPGLPVIRLGITDKNGDFTIKNVKPGPANITFHAYGYDDLTEQGVPLAENISLDRTLREKSTGWWLLLLFVPAILGMFISAIAVSPDFGSCSFRFLTAGIYGLSWFVVLLIPLVLKGITKYEFLYPSLDFEFYVPLLGFLGALLYVLDLSRKGQEEIDKEAEFQQRIILGPYVAIVMVVLFGKDLGLVKMTSPIGRAAIAFLSGLLVVAVFQRIVEKGQEMLGDWREKSSTYYAQSEIAKTLNLGKEDDLKLRKAGIRYLRQLHEYLEERLIEKVQEVGFDPSLAATLKRELAEKRLHLEIIRDANISPEVLKKLRRAGIYNLGQLTDLDEAQLVEITKNENFSENFLINLKQAYEQLQKHYDKVKLEEKRRLWNAIGNLVWEKLRQKGINSLEDFSHLSNKALEAIEKTDPQVDQGDLIKLRDRAKRYSLFQC